MPVYSSRVRSLTAGSRFVERSMEKTVDVEAKTSFQLSSRIGEIDFRYLKGYRPLTKKERDKTNREYGDKDRDKAMSNYSFSANNQPQAQASKKDRSQESRRRSHPATGVNAAEVAKKDKNKAKDLSHIKCYTYKQEGHYANKCPEKPKN